MKNTEQYYTELLRLIKNEKKIPSQKKLAVPRNSEGTQVSSHRVRILLTDDWLSMAECSIPAFRSAVSQDRKRLQNEIYRERIELVRKTSSTSVRELSRHSETLQPSASGIMPETLFVPRNDEDYHIYDNRFLYTVLIFLRNFIDTVLSKVNEANRGTDRMVFALRFENNGSSVQLHGEYTAEGSFLDGQRGDISFQRAEILREETEDLLHSPLLSSFNENDLLELPIQPTNVILMDPAFVRVNELLDYLVSYDKDGYVRNETDFEQKTVSADGISEISAVFPLISAICEAETGGIDREKLQNPSAKTDRMSPERLKELLADAQLKAYSEELEQMYREKERLYEEELEQMYRKKEQQYEEALTKDTEIRLRNQDLAFAEEKRILESQMTALKLQFGLEGEEDYQTEEAFLQLEARKDAFDRFYSRQLSKMKREARKKYVWDVLFPGKKCKKAAAPKNEEKETEK